MTGDVAEFEAKLERSSLGTPSARAARSSVSDEIAAGIFARADAGVHPAALNGEDLARMKRYGIPETRAIVDLVGAVKTDAFDAGRADVLENGDGFHTFEELYEFRGLYHAAFVNLLAEDYRDNFTVKSWRHSDGEECFGGGWFIVVTTLPHGEQVSNHYEAKWWELFKVPAVDIAPAFDGHSAADVRERLRRHLAMIASGTAT